jgi:hypothetical protein
MKNFYIYLCLLSLIACGAPNPEKPQAPGPSSTSAQGSSSDNSSSNSTLSSNGLSAFSSMTKATQARVTARYLLILNTEQLIANLADQHQTPSNANKEWRSTVEDMYQLCIVSRHNPVTDLKAVGIMNLQDIYSANVGGIGLDRCPIKVSQKVDFYPMMGLAKSSLEMESIAYSRNTFYAKTWNMRGEVNKKVKSLGNGIEAVQIIERYSGLMESKSLGKIPYTKFVDRQLERSSGELRKISSMVKYVLQVDGEYIEVKRKNEWQAGQTPHLDNMWINGEPSSEAKLLGLQK